MILLRVIPLALLDGLEIPVDQFGFTLIKRGNELQVWVERAALRD